MVHAVSQKFLQSYLDEYALRYNRRDYRYLCSSRFWSRFRSGWIDRPLQQFMEVLARKLRRSLFTAFASRFGFLVFAHAMPR